MDLDSNRGCVVELCVPTRTRTHHALVKLVVCIPDWVDSCLRVSHLACTSTGTASQVLSRQLGGAFLTNRVAMVCSTVSSDSKNLSTVPSKPHGSRRLRLSFWCAETLEVPLA